MNRTTKRFVRRWAMYPVRSMMYKHSKKIIWAVLALGAALLLALLGAVPSHAADPTTSFEPDTSGLNEIAAAISEQASRIDEYVDNINVSDVADSVDKLSGLMNAPFDGAPVIIMVALAFVMVVIVGKKVLAR